MRENYVFLPHVHTKQGSDSKREISHGNTVPLVQRPWGMASFSVQTREDGNWFYHPIDNTFFGIRLTHQPSPWIGDFASMTFSLSKEAEEYDCKNTVIFPHLMKIQYPNDSKSLELTPSERGCIIRINSESEGAVLWIRPTDNTITVQKIEENRLYGSINSFTGIASETNDCIAYFVIELKNPIKPGDISEDEQGIAVSMFGSTNDILFAMSYISTEQALSNLKNEILGKTFDFIADEAGNQWEELLGRIDICNNEPKIVDTFYSCLYRTFLYPNKLYERSEHGKAIHFDPISKTVKNGVIYTNNGFWDTYRTVYPLYAIIVPEQYREIIEGYIGIYRDSGWLPKWPSFAETGIMPGTLIDAVIADAAVKGILSGDNLKEAYEAVRKHATTVAPKPYGRPNIDSYLQYGYIPAEDGKESVNNTMDYAYGDFCISKIAELLGDSATEELFLKRSQNYRLLYDKASGFMRPKNRKGDFLADFDPFAWGGAYTEGGPWQSIFSVCYDLEGLSDLHGGKEKIIEKLDELFSTPPIFHVGGYGFEIHEMTEMAALGFGQCAISNEPSFHYPWLYSAFGMPEKSEYWIRRIVNEVFSFEEDGFPGDEDNGTMAAWYVFAILGMYPICPGKNEYVRITPIAKDIKIKGRPFPVEEFGGLFSFKEN